MNPQSPPFVQISDAPPKVPEYPRLLNQQMSRWLEDRQATHLRPGGTSHVVSRPFTDEERRAREKRLRERSKESSKPPVHYSRKRRVPPTMQITQETSPRRQAKPPSSGDGRA